MKSFKELIGEMNGLALSLVNSADKKLLTSDEYEILHAVADGLTEKYIMNRISGKCSLAAMMSFKPGDAERQVKAKIKILKRIKAKLIKGGALEETADPGLG